MIVKFIFSKQNFPLTKPLTLLGYKIVTFSKIAVESNDSWGENIHRNY
jgi:hypothetical protein